MGSLVSESVGVYDGIVETCLTCGVKYAFSVAFYNERQRNLLNFYCPNGHAQHYVKGKSREQRLREEIEAKRREVERERRIAAQERDRADRNERRRAAAVGQVTKIKKRVGKGVCPCCNRYFTKLHDHMKTEHPEYADAPVAEEPKND